MTNPRPKKVEYDLQSVKLPYVVGLPLRLFVTLRGG
jgi:hypothetical protein